MQLALTNRPRVLLCKLSHLRRECRPTGGHGLANKQKHGNS
ncbi:Uncharacterised protein [Achromobacter sp. 2789STDY5608628]|nr:Uncharacterised protein [Achromobacter sp. 2789STDY5608628]